MASNSPSTSVIENLLRGAVTFADRAAVSIATLDRWDRGFAWKVEQRSGRIARRILPAEGLSHAQDTQRSVRESARTHGRSAQRAPGRRHRPVPADQAGALEREGAVLHRAARAVRQARRGAGRQYR